MKTYHNDDVVVDVAFETVGAVIEIVAVDAVVVGYILVVVMSVVLDYFEIGMMLDRVKSRLESNVYLRSIDYYLHPAEESAEDVAVNIVDAVVEKLIDIVGLSFVVHVVVVAVDK